MDVAESQRLLDEVAWRMIQADLEPGERIEAVIVGQKGNAVVGTDRRLFVHKKGVLGGAVNGPNLASWRYPVVGTIDLKKTFFSLTLNVSAPPLPEHAKWTPHAVMLNPNALKEARLQLDALLEVKRRAIERGVPNPPESDTLAASNETDASQRRATNAMTDGQPTVVTSGEPPPPTVPPQPPRKRGFHDRALWQKAVIVIVVVYLGSVIYGTVTRSGGSPSSGPGTAAPVQVSGLGTRQQGIEFLGRHGFSGEESPLMDGEQRWLLRGPNSSLAELTGPPGDLTEVSLTTIASAEAGGVAGEWLGLYAPGRGVPFFREVLDDAPTADQDRSIELDDRTLRVQTLAFSDGAIVILSVTED